MITYLIIVSAVIHSALSESCFSDSPNGEKRFLNTKEPLTLYDNQLSFSLKLFQAINKFYPEDNVFFSPHSIYQAMLTVSFLANGTTLRKMKKSLFSNNGLSKSEIYKAYKLENERLQELTNDVSGGVEFSCANRIYVERSLNVRPCMRDLFVEEIRALDFKNKPDISREEINNWVATHTKDMIKNLLPPGAVHPDSKTVIVNAAYFKGIWKHMFKEEQTTRMTFYESFKRTSQVIMMSVRKFFSHGVLDDLSSTVLKLPYKNSDISMFILLPSTYKHGAVSSVLNKLNDSLLSDILNVEFPTMNEKEVDVKLPKFSMEQEMALTNYLESIGIGDLFEVSADLSELTGRREITLNECIHKARIDVSENGTDAAAATSIFMFRSSRPANPTQFHCNYPFIYFIYDQQIKSILFAGIFRKPDSPPI